MPKLTDSCLLVSLNISSFSGTKTDRKLTNEVTETHKTKGDALRVVKKLVSPNALQGFKKIESEARVFHRENTVLWLDDGSRMLPSKHHGKYMQVMRGLRERFEEAAADFISKWPATIAQAKIDLNGTFNEDDYPDATTISNHFRFRIGCAPVPDSGDIRVDLPAQEMESIRREISDRVREAEELAKNDLYARLGERLAAMINKLSTKDGVFRDSLVGNVLEMVNLIPALNVTNDPKLDQIRRELIQTLGSVRPDDLRDDKILRTDVTKKAQDILESMNLSEGQP